MLLTMNESSLTPSYAGRSDAGAISCCVTFCSSANKRMTNGLLAVFIVRCIYSFKLGFELANNAKSEVCLTVEYGSQEGSA
jgi:hypothetical protein